MKSKFNLYFARDKKDNKTCIAFANLDGTYTNIQNEAQVSEETHTFHGSVDAILEYAKNSGKLRRGGDPVETVIAMFDRSMSKHENQDKSM